MGDDYHEGSTCVELDPGLGYQPSDRVPTLSTRCTAFFIGTLFPARGVEIVTGV